MCSVSKPSNGFGTCTCKSKPFVLIPWLVSWVIMADWKSLCTSVINFFTDVTVNFRALCVRRCCSFTESRKWPAVDSVWHVCTKLILGWLNAAEESCNVSSAESDVCPSSWLWGSGHGGQPQLSIIPLTMLLSSFSSCTLQQRCLRFACVTNDVKLVPWEKVWVHSPKGQDSTKPDESEWASKMCFTKSKFFAHEHRSQLAWVSAITDQSHQWLAIPPFQFFSRQHACAWY